MNKQKPTGLKFKRMKEKLLIIMIVLVGSVSFAQVKIGDNTAIVDSSSVLELESTAKGFLPPRLTSTQRDAINAPATGLVIYNTTTNSLETNIGTSVSPVWSSSSTTASNGLTVSGFDLTLGGTLNSATTINQNNNDLTLTTGTGKVVVNGTLKTTGAVYGKVRKVTSFPIVWQDDDYMVILEVPGQTGTTFNFPPPDGANSGRIIYIRNGSVEAGGVELYQINTNIPNGNSSIGARRGQMYISNGISWYQIGGF